MRAAATTKVHSPVGRSDFVNTVPSGAPLLEIGPFNRPTFAGRDIRYFDILSAEEIRSEAERLERATDAVPTEIHYVQRTTALKDIPERFGVVYSSHSIEHTTDLLGHLNEVSGILAADGCYYLVIPDKRYCFDHYKPLSSVGDAIDAHERRATDYSLALWIDRALKSSHNDPSRHWRGDHGGLSKENLAGRVRQAVEEYKSGYRYKMSPHIWCFTPESFSEIMEVAEQLGYIDLALTDIYPTRYRAHEFYAVLKKRGPSS